ncbi:MAG: GntR family transcriptional regulator [Cyclobacteriaceae bacterium]
MEKLKITFEDKQSVPKYRQIIEVIQHKIKDCEWKRGDKIPSLNQWCKQYGLSQDTVLMAYNELKAKGIITSQVGKGYFIQNDKVDVGHKVLMLFDKLTAYKESLYEAFQHTMKGKGVVQLFFHHNNLQLFQTILEMANGEYSAYVIMPMADKAAKDLIGQLPKNKVYILDQGKKDYKTTYPFVCQDFENDIHGFLKENIDTAKTFKRFVLVTGNQGTPRKEIASGFKKFCQEFHRAYELVTHAQQVELKPQDLVLVIDDRDLEQVVLYALNQSWEIGKDIGIISYNETPLKGLIANGISTITTDFTRMGQSMAEMIVHSNKKRINNPFLFIKRNSF